MVLMNTSIIHDIPSEKEAFVFPASFNQQSLWFLDRLEPNSAIYNIPISLRLCIPLKVEILEQSLNAVIQRHEVLRTTLLAVDGQPMQAIAPELTVKLSLVDLRHLSEAEGEVEALRLATEEAQRPFKLAQGPLLRAMLLQLGAEEYVLLLTIHHSIFDGSSTGILLRELVALYEVLSNDQPLSLPELPIQYADYAVWQREWLQGEVLAEQLAYWKQQLASVPAVLELPTNRPRPAVPTYRGAMQPFALSKHLTDGLKTLSCQEGVTLYMTLVGAFQVLLHRYTGQDDILIGSPVAGRTRTETKNLLGFFINTLVLRSDMSGNPTFRELLKQVREVIFEAHAHQDVPFEYLVKELQPERNRGQNPLFQALLTLNPPSPSLPDGWNLGKMDIQTATSKFDLSILVEDGAEGIFGCFEYSTDLFDAPTIERLVGHWQILLEGIVAAPEQRIAELPLLAEAERHQLLVEWNATATAYPRHRCVHQLFEEQVERTPDAIALVFDDQQMTYRELNGRANQLAHYLQHLAVGPEVMVGLCMERSFDMVVALLGILKAGGAYIPLDSKYPPDRLAFMLQDTQVPVLVTLEQFSNVLPTQGTQVICLDTQWHVISRESQENPVSGAVAENLAYVMYTSGSTGKPKGTEIRHFSINRLVFGVDYAQLDATQTILHMASISFDASTFEVWGALLHGARCILLPEDMQTPKSIGQVVQKYGVTTAWITASLFNVLIDEVPETLKGIQQLLTGGEALSVPHIRRALNLLPSTQLINGYGPHESTTFACCYRIPTTLSADLHSIPIGRPIGNTQIYVLDRYGNPVPIGVPGELHIGGAGLARSYLNRPELTHEKFIPHPFSDEPGERLYKTGDLVRYLPDGNIEFLGRRDNQIKIRGFRVELGEIEAILDQYPAVHKAVVLVRENARQEKCLIAYIVPDHGQAITSNELHRFMQEKLPEYMVPSDFLSLESFPTTPNGKLDIHVLPLPDVTKRLEEGNFVAPTLPLHHQLVEIWEDLLNVRPVGITDNFFSLGGHSLLAARMVDRIEQVCGKKIPLSTLFSGATIEHLANLLLKEDILTGDKAQREVKEEGNPRAKVVTVQAGGARRPFFFLHGDWYGGGFYCMNLARGLDREQPFYVLEPYEFDRVQVPLTFEEMASAHIETMRAVQPEGPYLLGGFCNGGLVAYEIARQLHAVGQKVDLLVLIDPATPHAHRSLRKVISRFGSLMHMNQNTQLNWFLRYLYWKIPSYRTKVQESKNLRTPEQVELEGKRKEIRGAGFALPQLNIPGLTPEALRYQWSGIYRWVGANYTPGPYPGTLTLFWSSQAFSHRVNWQKVSGAKEVEDHVFPGTHMSCRNENLHVVAERLNVCINKVQEGVPGSADQWA